MVDPLPTATLGNSLLFLELPADTLAALAPLATRRFFNRGDAIFQAGAPEIALHVLISGRVRIVGFGEAGDDTEPSIRSPISYLGELSIIDGNPQYVCVEALEPVETISISRSDFLAFLRTNPQTLESLFQALGGRIRHDSETVADLRSRELGGQVARLLLQLADEQGRQVHDGVQVTLSINAETPEAKLGMTRTSFNGMLRRFENQGVIARRGRHIVILDRDSLRGSII
jgi:CRP-like cAMP-binding protein